MNLKNYTSDYVSKISSVGYGVLVIKKPRKEQFAIINLKLGKMQAGYGFSLTQNDLNCLSEYYRYRYPVPPQFTLFELVERSKYNLKSPSCQEISKRAGIWAQKLNDNPKFKGAYGDACSNYSDGYSDIEFYNRMDKKLQSRARRVGLFLIRYPNPIFNLIRLGDCYIVFDLKSGTIVKGDRYTCHVDDVLDYIALLEKKKAQAKAAIVTPPQNKTNKIMEV